MAHSLIIGRTESGKSALAKQICTQIRAQNNYVLAFNPLNEKGYARRDAFNCIAADWESANADEFVATVRHEFAKHERLFLVIDECQLLFDQRGNSPHLWLGTQGRHMGLNLLLISQRGVLVNPTVRGQCRTLYLFQCSLTDADAMADEYGHKSLKEATNLPRKHYFKCDGQGVQKFRLT